MSPIGFIIFATAFSIGDVANADNQQKAIDALIKASYYQFDVDKEVKKIEEKYTPDLLKENPWIAYTAKVAIEKKITLQWKF